MKFALLAEFTETRFVAPLAGAWIEIRIVLIANITDTPVAPLAGAWIEIPLESCTVDDCIVAPLAGAWIEISITGDLPCVRKASLPSRERGLK